MEFFEILFLFYPLFQYGIEGRRPVREREEGNERERNWNGKRYNEGRRDNILGKDRHIPRGQNRHS